MSESKSFMVTVMKWHISGQQYKHLARFSRIVLLKPAASTMQKINPLGCFNVCHLRLVYIYIYVYIYLYIHLFPVM